MRRQFDSSMPGKHSPEKLRERRDRARIRHYLVPRLPNGHYVQVPQSIAPRVKAVAASLSLQECHNSLSGESHAFARSATRAVRDRLDPGHYKDAMHKHYLANSAKHVWAVPTSPVCGASSSPLSSPLPSGVCVATQTDSYFRESDDRSEFQFNNLATEFVPAPQPFAATLPLGFDPQPLFDAQNSTIALLAGRLDALAQGAPSHKRLRELERQVKHLAGTVETLRTSLSSSIESKFAQKMPELRGDFVSKADLETALGGPQRFIE